MYSSDLCFSMSVPSRVQLSYIRVVFVPMRRCRLFVFVLVLPIGLMRVGDTHSCISVVHPFGCLLLIVSCNGCFVFPLIFLYSIALLSFLLCSTGNI